MLMLSLYCKVKALLASRDRGATAAEYALIVAAMTAAIAAIIFLFGDAIQNVFSDACSSIGETCAAP